MRYNGPDIIDDEYFKAYSYQQRVGCRVRNYMKNGLCPLKEIKKIYSPPKGRNRKNVHNMSQSSSDEASPNNKRSRAEDENIQKVQDFIKQQVCQKSGAF